MKSVCIHNGTVLGGYAVMENHTILLEDGKISGVFSRQQFEQKRIPSDTQYIDADGAWIAPGFIDTHIHGYGGFGTDDAMFDEYNVKDAQDSMIQLSRLLVKSGVTAFNPTVYPAVKDTMTGAIAKIASVMGKEDGARIMGLHLEGPFLSLEKPGVMRLGTIYPVDLDCMEQFWNAAEGHIINMTVAPELENMSRLAGYCNNRGIILQAGHTNASYEEIIQGMQMGIFHCTHLFNAMRRMEQRNPNAVEAILSHSEMSCELIPDGIHVHPGLIKLIAQIKPADKIVMVTDSLRCTGQNTGILYANGDTMVYKDSVFRRIEDDIIGGSAITMIQGIKNLVQFGFSVENAVKAASLNPARAMGYSNKGIIAAGKDADITIFDKDFIVRSVIAGGELKFKG